MWCAVKLCRQLCKTYARCTRCTRCTRWYSLPQVVANFPPPPCCRVALPPSSLLPFVSPPLSLSRSPTALPCLTSSSRRHTFPSSFPCKTGSSLSFQSLFLDFLSFPHRDPDAKTIVCYSCTCHHNGERPSQPSHALYTVPVPVFLPREAAEPGTRTSLLGTESPPPPPSKHHEKGLTVNIIQRGPLESRSLVPLETIHNAPASLFEFILFTFTHRASLPLRRDEKQRTIIDPYLTCRQPRTTSDLSVSA